MKPHLDVRQVSPEIEIPHVMSYPIQILNRTNKDFDLGDELAHTKNASTENKKLTA